MSTLIVPVATINSIRPHPSADRLDIAQVLGWQVVVKRGEFHEGQAVVYFPVDTVLSKEFSDHLGVTSYLSKGRIKATRLRGEPSFGLVIAAPEDAGFTVGDNVAERYPWVSKYEPPTREAAQRGQGKFIDNPDAVPRNPLFPEYTHIENLRHFPDIFADGELVVVTEKLHGTNSRIGMVNGEWLAGSHRMQRGQGDALYWSPRKHAEKLVESLGKHHKQVVLYGEILGADVQSLDYGYKGYEGYRAFDLMVDGRYVDYATFWDTAFDFDVPTVPVFRQIPFSFEEIRRFAGGTSTLRSANHLREGVVVKPLIERHDPRVGRVILKYISDDFLLAKKSDFAEV